MNTYSFTQILLYAVPDLLLGLLGAVLAATTLGRRRRWTGWLLAGAVVVLLSVGARVGFEFAWYLEQENGWRGSFSNWRSTVMPGFLISRVVGYSFWLIAFFEIEQTERARELHGAMQSSRSPDNGLESIPPIQLPLPGDLPQPARNSDDLLVIGSILGLFVFPPLALVIWLIVSNRLAVGRDKNGPLSVEQTARLRVVYWISSVGALIATAALIFLSGVAAIRFGWFDRGM